MFGNFDPEALYNKDKPSVIIFLFAVALVLLNLYIAIVGDIFDEY